MNLSKMAVQALKGQAYPPEEVELWQVLVQQEAVGGLDIWGMCEPYFAVLTLEAGYYSLVLIVG
jgi:hypothetical protein